jgi:hypothetical protein
MQKIHRCVLALAFASLLTMGAGSPLRTSKHHHNKGGWSSDSGDDQSSADSSAASTSSADSSAADSSTAEYTSADPTSTYASSAHATSAYASSANPTSAYASPAVTSSVVAASGSMWKPSAGLSWDYQLTGTIDVASNNVDVWDIDLFDADASTIDAIHAKGKKAICYFSAGTFEDWRPDASKFQSSDKGSSLPDWPGESWLSTKSSNVRNIMLARLDMAAQKKCDGVEPDNVDGYDNSNGLGLTANDAVDYINFLTQAAHSRNLAIGLKNSGSIVSSVVDTVEYCVQEQCVQYNDCQEFQPFIQKNKPVFHVEYSGSSGSGSKRAVAGTCTASSGSAQGFSSIVKNLALDAWVQVCS